MKIIKYSNTIEFVEDISRIQEQGFYLYSADDYTANRMLKDYFPERYEVRNLLSYPIGQFVYMMHKMWDENRQCIILSAEGLRKCFASGWLAAHGKSSIQYTDDLERILPYFENCYTLKEWNERLSCFSDAYDNAYDVFSQTEEETGLEKRKQRALANPLSHFGPFSIGEDRIREVIDLIDQLIRMAKELFASNEPVSIQQHMSKLDALLYFRDGMPQDLYREEKEKIKQIFLALENDQVKDFMCYPGDLAAALLSFMSGTMEDETDDHHGLKTLVFNIFQIESASVFAKEKVHICLADITKLPGTSGSYHWPLDETILREIAEKTAGTYASDWLENNRLTALANRYYVYNALKNKDVEISWIYQQGEKRLSPSPYITLLDQLSDAGIQDSTLRNLDLQYVNGVMVHKRLDKTYSIKENKKWHLYEDELEYALCPMRYVYSCVLGENFAYMNEYQQNRAIVRLIQVLNALLKGRYSMEQIAQQVFELFPYIRKAEKRQMLDDAICWNQPEGEGSFTEAGNYQYTDERLKLVFLDNQNYAYAEKMASMLMSQSGRTGIYPDRTGGGDSKNCEFCPHMRYCPDAIFGIDYKGDSE